MSILRGSKENHNCFKEGMMEHLVALWCFFKRPFRPASLVHLFNSQNTKLFLDINYNEIGKPHDESFSR